MIVKNESNIIDLYDSQIAKKRNSIDIFSEMNLQSITSKLLDELYLLEYMRNVHLETLNNDKKK